MTIIVHKVETVWLRFKSSNTLHGSKVARLVEEGVWTEADLAKHGLTTAVPFEAPEGHIIKPGGLETFHQDGSVVRQVRETIPVPRRMVPKSVIISRLTDNQLDAVMGILTTRQKERWRASDHPSVYFDDPDTVAALTAVGADVEEVMREGDEP